MKRTTVRTLLALAALVAMTGCIRNDYDTLNQRVQTQDQQLRQMQPMQADVVAQMQAMRNDLNAIKGQLDDLHNAGGARALVDRVNKHDAALRQVERSMAMNFNLDAPMAAGAAGAAGMPIMPTSSPAPSMGGETPFGDLSPQPYAPQAVPPAPPPAAPKDMATALFDAGLAAYNGRRYAEAERSFSDYTKNYPKDRQISSAWYYVGECQFQRNQFADAALSYDKVITQYPTSGHVSAAYLKQGIAFSKLGQTAAARARMQELIKKFPNSAEAARAKSFLQTNK